MPGEIAPDGNIVIIVTLKAPSIVPSLPDMFIQKRLIADTGGLTIIPAANVSPFFGRTTMGVGPMTGTNFGPLVDLVPVTMEAEVEDFGGGNPQIRSCAQVRMHFLNPTVFAPAEGLIAKDQFNNLHADPVKSADGTSAYLAKRIDYPAGVRIKVDASTTFDRAKRIKDCHSGDPAIAGVLCGGTTITILGIRTGGPVAIIVDYTDGTHETISVTVTSP